VVDHKSSSSGVGYQVCETDDSDGEVAKFAVDEADDSDEYGRHA